MRISSAVVSVFKPGYVPLKMELRNSRSYYSAYSVSLPFAGSLDPESIPIPNNVYILPCLTEHTLLLLLRQVFHFYPGCSFLLVLVLAR